MKRSRESTSPLDGRGLAQDDVVRRAAEGDHRAFEVLFRRHSPWVYGRLRRMLGARADLEDLVQDVFVRAFRSLPAFRGQARFESWLRRICARVAYDQIRARRTAPRFEVVEELPDRAMSGDMEQREAARQMMRLIERLPPKNRVVLLLHDVEGYTAPEIQRVIGARSVNTVRSRLRLARGEIHRLARSHPALSSYYDAAPPKGGRR